MANAEKGYERLLTKMFSEDVFLVEEVFEDQAGGRFIFIFRCFSIVLALVLSCGLRAQESSAQLEARHVPSVNLPLNHFSYIFIEKLESKGIIAPAIELRNKPYSRNTVTKIILDLDKKLKENTNVLTESERELFLKLKGEFHQELKPYAVDNPSNEIEKHIIQLYSKSDDVSSYVIGDVILGQSFDISRFNAREDTLNQNLSNTLSSGRVRGLLKDAIAFYSDFTSTLIKGRKIDFPFAQGEQGGILNYNPNSKNVYKLEANAYFVVEPKWFRLQFGKDAIVLGPGKHSNIFISNNAPAFDNIRLDVVFDRLKFTYIHGWLRSDPLAYNGSGSVSDVKYIAAHRLEFKVFPWLFVAGNESVIYGGRALQPAYLNPIMIIHIAEQYLGDKDNHQLAFDATAFPYRNLKTYASIYLDDFTTAKNPFSYWKQTWALLWGAYWVEPFHLSDHDFRVEYSRIEPYVYAHQYPLLNFSHFGMGLGSFLPPNSDDWFVEWRYWPLRRFNFGVTYEITRHGKGDINTFGFADHYVNGPGGKTRKTFLMVDPGMGVETKHIAGFNFQWETFHNHYFTLTYNYSHISNYQNTPRRTLIQNRLAVGYRLDY
jgi:hypothetical protein